ncbi:helix-turn-helix domain-containing protein [Streptacidiphilus sp. EB103A]|uniref:helix-turn-helix domain-containing protein n=1 Tax=Streptacidiphilus sp. EB103A TaxID=3156275 RepID=UPI0035180084
MARHLPSGVHLSAADCARLDAHLVRLLRDLQLRDGVAPRDLVEIVAPIHQAAAEFRTTVLVEAGSGTVRDSSGSVTGVSAVTERLSVHEAARFAKVSESYVRRLARRGAVRAAQSGSRGAWQLESGSLAAWLADRNEHQKAG